MGSSIYLMQGLSALADHLEAGAACCWCRLIAAATDSRTMRRRFAALVAARPCALEVLSAARHSPLPDSPGCLSWASRDPRKISLP